MHVLPPSYNFWASDRHWLNFWNPRKVKCSRCKAQMEFSYRIKDSSTRTRHVNVQDELKCIMLAEMAGINPFFYRETRRMIFRKETLERIVYEQF